MKSILISINPQPSCYILRGEKMFEVRTRILPSGYDYYGYVTKGKPFLQFNGYENQWELTKHNDKKLNNPSITQVNGKVPFKFQIGEVIEVEQECMDIYEYPRTYAYFYDDDNELLVKSCLINDELNDYGKGKTLYFHEITNLEIFDKPMELGEFYKHLDKIDTPNGIKLIGVNSLTKAPQSWQYVFVNKDIDWKLPF